MSSQFSLDNFFLEVSLLHVSFAWSLLNFLDLRVYKVHKSWKISAITYYKYFLFPPFLSFEGVNGTCIRPLEAQWCSIHFYQPRFSLWILYISTVSVSIDWFFSFVTFISYFFAFLIFYWMVGIVILILLSVGYSCIF